MKGSIAAMLVATEKFLKLNPVHTGSIAFLITSDEEGPFINGTTKVIDICCGYDRQLLHGTYRIIAAGGSGIFPDPD